MSWRSFLVTGAALGAAATLGFAQAPPPDDPVAELQRQVEAMRREIAELRAQRAAEAPSPNLEREVANFASRLQETSGEGNVSAPNAMRVTFGGSYRGRFSYARNRDFTAGQGNDDQFNTHRLRLNVKADVDEHTSLFAQIRSAFAWGTQGGALGPELANGELALHQGYGEFHDLMGSGWDARVGRQEFVYGDERVLSNNDWDEFGRAWDGAKFTAKFDEVDVDILWGHAVEAFFAFPAGTTSSDVDLYGLYVSYAGEDGFEGDVYVLPVENRATESLFLNVGARARAKVEMLDIGGEITAVRDRGDGDTSHVTFNTAYMVAGDAGLTFGDAEGSPRIMVGYSRGSDMYIPLVPDLHRYAGIMDVVNPFVNLIDYEAGISVSPMEDWTLTTSYHAFQHANQPTGSDGKTIGYELDVVLAGACTDHVRAEIGYGHFFPRNGFDTYAPGTALAFNPWTAGAPSDPNDADLVYLQFDVPF